MPSGASALARANAHPRKPWLAKHEHPVHRTPRAAAPEASCSARAASHSPPNTFVASHEIGAHEPILVAEQRVQRCFGNARALDDAVDADRMYPLLIEEMARGVEQSLPR